MANGHKNIEELRVWGGGEIQKVTYENIVLTTLLARRPCMKILDELDGFVLDICFLVRGSDFSFTRYSFLKFTSLEKNKESHINIYI
jgi:hypothetical protein